MVVTHPADVDVALVTTEQVIAEHSPSPCGPPRGEVGRGAHHRMIAHDTQYRMIALEAHP